MIKYLNNEEFNKEVIDSKQTILVDFFATWCGPCKMLTPVLEKISTSRLEFEIAKIDIDKEPLLASKYEIDVVPTMLIFKEGKLVDKIEGYVNENDIVSKMAQYI